MQILSNSEIIREINKLDVWLVSPGGSGSTTFNTWLTKNGYNIINHTWRKIGCHHGIPLNLKIPIIYLFADLSKAYMSVSRRKSRRDSPYFTNQRKLTNNYHCQISETNLWKSMKNQIENWVFLEDFVFTSDILIIKQNDLYTEKGKILVEKLLGRSFMDFPIEQERKSQINNFDDNIIQDIISYENRFKLVESRIIPSKDKLPKYMYSKILTLESKLNTICQYLDINSIDDDDISSNPSSTNTPVSPSDTPINRPHQSNVKCQCPACV